MVGRDEQRMARRRKRRRDAGLIITIAEGQATWDRHGDKLVALKKKKAKPPFFNYEKWLHQKAGEQMAEEVKRGEEVGVSRMRQIWHCVWHEESEQRWRTSPTLSQEARIAVTPRIRGCGAAAKRAGFAG